MLYQVIYERAKGYMYVDHLGAPAYLFFIKKRIGPHLAFVLAPMRVTRTGNLCMKLDITVDLLQYRYQADGLMACH